MEKIAWDKLLGRLRIHGTIRKAPETVPLGAHHTVNIALNKPLTIVKKKWLRHHVERLKRVSKTSGKPVTILPSTTKVMSLPRQNSMALM